MKARAGGASCPAWAATSRREPGHSNHQGGSFVDVSANGASYSSATDCWLADDGRRFDFVNDVRGAPWRWTFRG